MSRSSSTRSRRFAFALGALSLAIAACAHSGSTPNPNPTATPTTLPTGSFAPCSLTAGIAYEPDAGNGGSFSGVQVSHFEDNNGNLCASVGATTAPTPVAFAAPVEQLAISPASQLSFGSSLDAVALLRNASGAYTLAQDVFGAGVGQIVPAGAPYDVSALPTAPPTTSPSPGMATPTPTPVPSPLPVVPNASSVELLGQAASGVALVTGPAAGGLLALTSLTNAPPQYGSFVPFANQNNAYPINPPKLPRTTVRVNPFGFGYALVRGPSDLLDYSITDVATGFEFSAVADDTTLGTGAVTLYGRADIAFDPGNSGRALIGGTTSGSLTTLTLVTGLPTSITKTATLTLPANIRSIVIGPSGQYAVVGTDAGIAVVNGVNGSSLSLVAPFAPGGMPDLNILTYLGCDGKTTLSLTNVDSVELSTDDRYLVALGAPPGIACPNGYDASIVAIPFNPNSGATPSPSPTTAPSPGATPSPNPTMFTQNLVVPPPTGADLMVVR